MVLKITKETWKKCGIKTTKHYNKKEDMIELWQRNERRKNTNRPYKY